MSDARGEDYDAQMLEALRAELAPAIEIVRRLGAGGMGTVFLGRDPALKRLVAIKVLAPELARDPSARTRFEREAEAVAAIAHPNVVAVYSVGEMASGVPYFVMQYVSGRSCSERLETDGAFDVDATKRILGEVASALAAAHRVGIIHRDIKPANVLLEDATGRVVVSDFGIAAVRTKEDGAALKITQTGTSIGTPAYMSPEQLLAEPVTEKTDIYSLGLLGYELLTQQGAYAIKSPAEIMAAHLRDAPIRLSQVLQHVDPEFEALLESCLAKTAADRPSAAAVAQRLAGGSDKLLDWPPPGLEEVHGRLAAATGLLAAGAAALGLPLVLLASFDRSKVTLAVFVTSTVAAVGAVAFVAGAILLLRVVVRVVRGVRAGHGWLVAAEVAADHAHDAGLLIAGAREFAVLTANERSRLRRGRVVASALFLAAALMPVTGFLIALPFFTRGGPSAGAIGLLVFVGGATVALAVAGAVLQRRERERLRDARRRLRAPAATGDVLARHAASWRESFEQVRHGQSLGQGRAPRIALLVFGAAAGALLIAATATLAYVLLATTSLYQGQYLRFLQDLNSWTVRERIAQGMKPFAAAVDSTITPLRAGEALQSISAFGRTAPSSRWARPPARTVSGHLDFPLGTSPLFPGTDVTWAYAALRQARGGFTLAQHQLLLRAAADPLQSEFAVLEHASEADYEAAGWPLPLADSVRLDELPTPRIAPLREAAYAELARAALDVNGGRADRAEQRLRGLVRAGLAMTRGRNLIDNLIGTLINGIGRQALMTLFEQEGRAADARELTSVMLRAYESGDAQGRSFTSSDPTVTTEARLVATRDILRDSTSVAGIRWDLALWILPYEQCFDLHQLLFGADAAHRLAYADARKTMVRSRTDSLLFDVGERALDRRVGDPVGQAPSMGARAVRHAARGVDWLIGGHRLEACTAWLRTSTGQ